MLTWFEPYRTVLDTSDAPFWKWFVGGKINASYNCVDRHLANYGNKAAFIFVPEPEAEPDASSRISSSTLASNEVAALLRGLGLKQATRVTFHMPMVRSSLYDAGVCAPGHHSLPGLRRVQRSGVRLADSGFRAAAC